MNTPEWMRELQLLALRYPVGGLGADLASFTLAELWSVYCYLKGLEAGTS